MQENMELNYQLQSQNVFEKWWKDLIDKQTSNSLLTVKLVAEKLQHVCDMVVFFGILKGGTPRVDCFLI